MQFRYEELAKMIDHSLLQPTTTVDQLEQGCELARAYNVASVCILPYYLKRCTEILSGSSVMPSSTIGFPHGGHTTVIKLRESEQAIEDGCQELDMVVNISKVLSSDWSYVSHEVESVVRLAHAANRKVKVIFENCYLNDEHKKRLCRICCDSEADWVKTSTGYGTSGATIEDLQLMLDHVTGGVQVKAAGGIRDLATLIQVKQMGVSRVGASRTSEMLDAARRELDLPQIATGSIASSSGY